MKELILIAIAYYLYKKSKNDDEEIKINPAWFEPSTRIPVTVKFEATDQAVSNVMRFSDAMMAIGEAEKIEPAVIASIITRESEGDPGLITNGKYYGLMQIGQATAKGVGFSGSASNLLKPITNIKYGTRYFNDCLDRFDTIPRAISAYNYGSVKISESTGNFINQPYVNFIFNQIVAYRPLFSAKYPGYTRIFPESIYGRYILA